MTKLDLFRNLVILAFADRRLTEEELAYLSVKANKLGLTDQDVVNALAFARSSEASLAIPAEKNAGRRMLQELIQVMAADGKLDPREKDLFAAAAARVNLEQGELDRLLDELIES
jgi:uncharacterized tellurite resistance protein B-like protein